MNSEGRDVNHLSEHRLPTVTDDTFDSPLQDDDLWMFAPHVRCAIESAEKLFSCYLDSIERKEEEEEERCPSLSNCKSDSALH